MHATTSAPELDADPDRQPFARVTDRRILKVAFFPDLNRLDVPPQHTAGPDRDPRSKVDPADHHRARVDPRGGIDRRLDPIKRLDYLNPPIM